MTWAGVDVGAGKGFDVAAISSEGLVGGPERIAGVPEVVEWLQEVRPRVVAVDGPRAAARTGEKSRRCERDLVRAGVCGIRYTPDRAALRANGTYYGWIANGMALYAALAAEADWQVIECFPTAAWSRLGGRRGDRTRARWSQQVLDELGVRNLPARMNQDSRDALAAAVTAKLHDEGRTESFGGDIVVPLPPAGDHPSPRVASTASSVSASAGALSSR
jgi:predicted nuclease with RNAse H fold